jgi:hypothetical protein
MMKLKFNQFIQITMNTNTKKSTTIDPMEETKSSVDTISNLSKQLQALSGKLSEISKDLNNVKLIASSLQKHSDICSKNLPLLSSKHDSEIVKTAGCFNHNESREQYHSQYDRNQIFKMVKTILKFVRSCNGYPFGGVVRDLLVPYYRFKQDLKSLDFKDIDLWFTNEKDAQNFIQLFSDSLQGKKQHLIPSDMETYHSTDKTKYSCYPGFKRDLYLLKDHVSLNNVLYIDIIISKTLPVNDMSVNLLTMVDKDDFQLGRDSDDQYLRYTEEDVIDQIKNRSFELLTGYRSRLPYKVYQKLCSMPKDLYNNDDMSLSQKISKIRGSINQNGHDSNDDIIISRISKFLLFGWKIL